MKVCSNSPLVSVCVAAYNCEKYITDTFESLLSQDYENFEVVVIDDCSLDATYSLIQQYSKRFDNFRYVKNDVNLGYLGTFNRLLDLSCGELICFVDSDDWIAADKISTQVTFLNENQSIGLVGSGATRVGMDGKRLEDEIYPTSDSDIRDFISSNKKICFCGSSVMVRREVIEHVGGYNEFFKNCPGEDFDWILRIMNVTKVANVESSLYFYRFNPKSLTRKVHYDVKARHVSDIIFFMHEYRLKYNEEVRDESLNDFLLELKSEENKGELYYSTSIQHSINKNVISALRDLDRAIRLNKFSFKSLKNVVLVFVILLVPISLLLRAKSIFKVKNVAEKL